MFNIYLTSGGNFGTNMETSDSSCGVISQQPSPYFSSSASNNDGMMNFFFQLFNLEKIIKNKILLTLLQ